MTTEKKDNMEELIAQAIRKSGQEKDKQDIACLKRFMEEARPASESYREVDCRLRKEAERCKKDDIRKKKNKSRFKVKKLIITFTSMAAVFVLLFSLNIWHNNQLMNEAFLAYYSPLEYSEDLSSRGSENISSEALAAMDAYQQNDYSKALDLFDTAASIDNEYLIYKAICLIETEQYNKAASLLVELVNHGESTTYWQQANWYLANVYLKLHKEKEAIDLLKRIIEDGEYYSENASLILNSIN